MAKLKVGIVGFNAISVGHARAALGSGKAVVQAVADPVKSRREQGRDQFGASQVYTDYRDLIADSDTDAIVVGVFHHMHYEVTMAALKAGKHVICEKPPANTARETKEMVDLARRKGLQLTFGLQLRFMPEISVALREIGKGRLGHVYRIEMKNYRLRSPGPLKAAVRMTKGKGGAFMGIGIHMLDLAWALAGHPKPVRLVARGGTRFPSFNTVDDPKIMADDNMFTAVFFDNGAMATVDTAYASNWPEEGNGPPSMAKIVGVKAGLDIPSMRLVQGGKNAARARTLTVPKSWRKNAQQRLHENFYNAVLGREDLVIKPEHGLGLMKMIEAVYESDASNREVAIKI